MLFFPAWQSYFKATFSRLKRLESFESKIPRILARTFSPSSLSQDERIERLELLHVDAIMQFEQNWLVMDLKEGPIKVQVLMSCPITNQWLIRLPSGELRLAARAPIQGVTG